MPIKLDVYLHDEEIIDVINFLDQRNIEFTFDKDELFSEIVAEKNFDQIEFFLDRGSTPDEFIQFCNEDDTDVVNFLVEKNQDVTENDGEYLAKLISSKNFATAKKVIEMYKGNMDALVNYGEGKALIAAVTYGNNELVKLLLMNDAKIDNCVEDPIVTALVNNHCDLIPVLLLNGSSIESIMPEHLETCIKNRQTKSVNYISKLMYNNELAHFRKANLVPCFFAAVKANNIDLLKMLINLTGGIDVKLCKELRKYAHGYMDVYLRLIYGSDDDDEDNDENDDNNDNDGNDDNDANDVLIYGNTNDTDSDDSASDENDKYIKPEKYRRKKNLKIDKGGVFFRD